jgi:hypothetical protein
LDIAGFDGDRRDRHRAMAAHRRIRIRLEDDHPDIGVGRTGFGEHRRRHVEAAARLEQDEASHFVAGHQVGALLDHRLAANGSEAGGDEAKRATGGVAVDSLDDACRSHGGLRRESE